jgi:hypothetical protein
VKGIRELVAGMGPSSTAEAAEALLEHPDAEEAHVLGTLRKRNLAGSVIEAVARHERWGSRYSVRAAVVNHPKTPKTLALRLLNFLFWKELLRVTGNFRLSMPIRIAAERRLLELVPKLELGEKITMARRAPLSIVQAFVKEPNARVIDALLVNPRLREGEVQALAESPDTRPEILRVVAQSSRWASRDPVRLALVKNVHTPVHAALRLLVQIPKERLARLVSRHELPRVLLLRAERILAGE